MRLEIVIDELLLHGIDPRDRHRVADALQRELMRLAANDPQLGRHVAATDVLHAPESVLPPRVGAWSPAALGAQLAAALVATLAGAHPRVAQAPARPSSTQPSSAGLSVSGSVLPRAVRSTWRPASAGLHGSNRRGTP